MARLPYYSVIQKGRLSVAKTSQPKTKPQTFCKIVIILPETPVDLYVNGTLMAENVSRQFVMQTPTLAANKTFHYAMGIQHCGDPDNRATLQVTNIKAGALVTADFRLAKKVVQKT